MSITSLRGSTLPNKSFRAGRAKTRDVVTIAPDTATTFANGAAISAGGGGGGGPTISNVSVTNSGYIVSNTTPYIDSTGGFIKITGTGFATGCTVYVGGSAASSTTFISSTEVRAQVGAAASNAQAVYVVNTDNSVGILLNAITYSGTPSWSTGATLTSQLADFSFSIPLSATSDSAIVYTLASGSSTPSGTTLFSNGVFAGTITGITSDTNYSFTVVATDLENQLSARAFTVSVASGDTYFNTTTLLLNGEANVWITDSSTNKFLPTVNADVKPTAFSPYNTSWSGFFDGTGDYLDLTGSANLAFGTGDWTIELWIYFNSVSGDQIIYDSRPASTNGAYPTIYRSTTTIRYYTDTTERIQSSTITTNTWYHVVVSRVSGSTRMFVNGIVQATVYSDSTTYLNGASRPRIGDSGVTAGAGFNGYISNLRVLKGTGYTTVTVPTSALTTVANTQLLTLQDGRFKDNSTNSFTITRSGDTAIKSFGPFTETDTVTGSGYFDGTGDYLSFADNDAWDFGNGNFTVEGWFYATAAPTNGGIVSQISATGAATTSSFGLYYSSGSPYFICSLQGVGTYSTITSSTAATINSWHHTAAVRNGTTITLYLNGLSVGTLSVSTTAFVQSAASLAIGRSGDFNGDYFTGYLTDIRVVKGSALYTANFTPATSSVSLVANTQLLTLQYRIGENNHRFVDEAGIKHPLTRAGQVSQGSFSPFSPAGWSAYFDGTGDFLTITRNAVFFPGSSTNFTIEAWVFITSVPINNGVIIGAGSYTIDDDWNLSISTSLRASLYIKADATTYQNTTTLSYNIWYHIAAVRNGTSSNNLTVYVNGVGQSFSTNSSLNAATSYNITIGCDSSAAARYTGYISNLRMVNGLAVYTGNFTPGTTILGNTQSAGSNIAAITSGSTFLSLQDNRFRDNGVNAFAIARSGDTRIQAFSPFRATVVYSPATHGGSAFFDGSGDYITTVSTTSTILPTSTINTFTIDGWLYPTALGALKWIIGDMQATGGSNNVSVDLSSSNFVELYWYDGAAKRATSTTAVVLNQWNYFAIVVNNNAITIYVNSTTAGQGGTTTLTTRSLGTSGWAMGAWNSADYYSGYMSGMRWTNGVARTISSIPTAPPSLDANTSVLMNFTQGGLIDASARNNLETAGTVKIRGNITKFGIGSFFFDTSYGYVLITPAVPLLPTIGDYTVEFWVYATAADTTLMCINTTTAVFAACRLQVNANGSVSFLVSTSSPNVINAASSAATFAYNTWQHIAVVRNGGTHSVYINGTSRIASTTIAATTAVQGGVESVLGAIDNRTNSDFASFFGGYIDDLRITRFARYTSDFTPPTTAVLTK